MHKLVAVLAACALGGLVVACGDDDDTASTTPTGPTTAVETKSADVAFITYLYFDFQKVEEQGIKDAVEPGGGSVKVFNANFDPQALQSACTDVVQSGRYNAIVIAPIDAASATPCARAAKDAGIPVVTIEGVIGEDPNKIEPQVDGVVGSIVLTVASASQLYAEQVRLACEGIDPCEAIAEEIPGEPFTNAWVDAVNELPNVEVVQTFDTQYDPAETAKKLPSALARNPGADVFMASQDEAALVAIDIAREAGKPDVKLVGTGGSRRAADAIAAGTMFSTLGSWPLQYGQLAGEMLIKAVNGQPIETPGVDATKVDEPGVVTKETVGQFTPEWGAE